MCDVRMENVEGGWQSFSTKPTDLHLTARASVHNALSAAALCICRASFSTRLKTKPLLISSKKTYLKVQLPGITWWQGEARPCCK